MAPGFSYDKFIKSYDIELHKSFFPYEFCSSFEKLEHTQLPPYEAFFSSLKNCNVLEEEFSRYKYLIEVEKIPLSKALKLMNIKEKPRTGLENYQFLLKTWQDQGMRNMKDYLKYYNNLDVLPFCQAVSKMLQFYMSRNIDLFKTCISVPGVARELVFRSRTDNAHFACFDKNNKDLYQIFRKGMCGGPAIIFQRYHERDKTFIRQNENKICKKIIGYDANALYLWALKQKMPTGAFTIRKEEEGFRLIKRDRYLKAFYYLEWLRNEKGLEIDHYFNKGKEFRIGPYLVDGFSRDEKKVFEFNGCYFHHHDCELTKNIINPKWLKEKSKYLKREKERLEYIRRQGYEIEIFRECQYENLIKTCPQFQNFVTTQRNQRPLEYRATLSSQEIINAILEDKIFGTAEVDIHVPDHLLEKFSEMSPIFCNSNIPFEALGTFTQDTGRRLNLTEKPRRLLVGGMRARKILLATPLLKWYLNHGLIISRVYQISEFSPNPCFRQFTEDVSNARRQGDTDPTFEIFADTMKLIGNSAYGSMIMNKEKHVNITYCESKEKASYFVSKRRFRNLTELDNNHFEIELAKSRITLNLPIQIGFFILQYAKLRMLEFYYDCVDKFCSREDFELMSMDTDSYYMSIAGENFTDIIKPELKKKFDEEKQFWFPRSDSLEVAAFDHREPGLFKEEFIGTSMVALCSKTYCVENHTDTIKSKFSCKGLNKRNFSHPIALYKQILNEKTSAGETNRGFRALHNTIFTYTQYRQGLTSFYPKRKVLSDGVSTTYLDITLSPWE